MIRNSIKFICFFVFAFIVFLLGFSKIEPHLLLIQDRANTVVAQQRMQRNLDYANERNVIINDTLAKALPQMPSVARIRVGFIHLHHDESLRFDITHAVANPGHDAGPIRSDMPIAAWGDYLDSLLNNQCKFIKVKDLSDIATRNRLSLIIDSFVACPIMVDNRLVGALFVSWDKKEDVPSAQDLLNIVNVTKNAANKIGEAILPEEQY
jgi:transcriptional regulator with GAF, ATPase, and Fis domain